MPITIDADPARNLLIARASGELTFACFVEFIRSARTGERDAWSLLFDMTGATSSITAEQIRSLAVNVGSVLRNEGMRGTVAIVADSDVLFGMMRMYQILCEQQGVSVIHVYRERREAEAALGI